MSRRSGRSPSVLLAAAIALACAACDRPTATQPPPIAPSPAVATSSGAAAAAADVYARVAPSVAYVETSISSGSAVLITDDLLVTCAHVAWPDESVRVVFADGSERQAVPVADQDLIADLAVLDLAPSGGAPASSRPATIADGTRLPVGSELYLVGYPGESESMPEPAIARGILSRHRDWPSVGLPFLQTDAAIAGGQSGGALVDPDGRVLGFSSMRFADGAFGIAASAPHAMQRIERMLAGEDVDGLTERALPRTGGSSRQTIELAGEWSASVLVAWTRYGEAPEARLDSAEDAAVYVTDAFGELLASADESRSGVETASWDVYQDGPAFVTVYLDEPGAVDVRSSVDLLPYQDPDEGARLEVGQSVAAAMDYPGDADTFVVDLTPGRVVTITVDTVNLVPEVTVEPWELDRPQPDVSVRLSGPLGLTLEAAVTARRSGRHAVIVRDAEGYGTGGYLIGLE